jgi:hypothetical protein
MSPRTRFAAVSPALIVLGLVACSGGTDSGGPPTTAIPTAPPSTSTTTAPAKPAPTPEQVVTVLGKAGATGFLAATAENDENHMLGRPGQYTARVAFELPGGDPDAKVGAIERGGGFEIWPDAASARRRHEFITGMLQATPLLGTEYDYLAGAVLVRVTGKVPPATAKKVEDAMQELPR